MIDRAKWTVDGATTLLEIAEMLEGKAGYYRELAEVPAISLQHPVEDDYIFLSTEDSAVAEQWGFWEEDWDDDEDWDDSEDPE
jgi:hypothetical protein